MVWHSASVMNEIDTLLATVNQLIEHKERAFKENFSVEILESSAVHFLHSFVEMFRLLNIRRRLLDAKTKIEQIQQMKYDINSAISDVKTLLQCNTDTTSLSTLQIDPMQSAGTLETNPPAQAKAVSLSEDEKSQVLISQKQLNDVSIMLRAVRHTFKFESSNSNVEINRSNQAIARPLVQPDFQLEQQNELTFVAQESLLELDLDANHPSNYQSTNTGLLGEIMQLDETFQVQSYEEKPTTILEITSSNQISQSDANHGPLEKSYVCKKHAQRPTRKSVRRRCFCCNRDFSKIKKTIMKRFECKACPKKYVNERDLKKHMKAKH